MTIGKGRGQEETRRMEKEEKREGGKGKGGTDKKEERRRMRKEERRRGGEWKGGRTEKRTKGG